MSDFIITGYPESVWVFDDWMQMAKWVHDAEEDNEWELLSDAMHSGMMAILVNGLPRVIHGEIH